MPSQFWSKMTGQGGGQIKKYPKCKKNITKKLIVHDAQNTSRYFFERNIYIQKKSNYLL